MRKMLDQTTDRMWYMIGAILLGAAIIGAMLFFMPEAFASVGGMFDDFIGKVVIGGSEDNEGVAGVVVDDDSLQEYLARTYDKGDNDLSMSVRHVTGEDSVVNIVKYNTIIDTFLSKDMLLEDLEGGWVTREQMVDELQLAIGPEQEGEVMAMSDDEFVDFVLQLIREPDMLPVFAMSQALLLPEDSTTVVAMYYEGDSYYSQHYKEWNDSENKDMKDNVYFLTDGQTLVTEYDRMVNDGLIVEHGNSWIEYIMSRNREVLMQNAAFIDRYKGMSEDSLSQIFTGPSEYGQVFDYGLGYHVMYVQRDSLYEVEFVRKDHEMAIEYSSYTSPKKDGAIEINGLTYDRYIGYNPFIYDLVS